LNYIGQDETLSGQKAGELFAQNGVTHGVCVSHAQTPALEQRCKGFTQAMQAAGKKVDTVNLPLSQAGNPTYVTHAIQGILTKNKDVDGIYTLGSAIATDAIQAVEAAGKTGKVKIATNDISTQVLHDVQSGTLLAAIDQQPYLQGFYSITELIQNLLYKVIPSDQLSTGPFLITKANVNDVLAVNEKYPGVRGAQ
jgi:simple sugar transport system substrate-binding protein